MAENLTVPEPLQVDQVAHIAARGVATWTNAYLRMVVIADACCGLGAGLLAFEVRFGGDTAGAAAYFWLGLALPALWLVSLALAGAYDPRFIGVGTEEFRRVVNTGVGLTATVAIAAYVTKTDLARGYVVVSLPCLTVFDLLARYWLRKRLHHLRALGNCMRRVVVVGHPNVVTELAVVLRRDSYHGLSVVAACVLGLDCPESIDGIPAVGGLGNVVDVVQRMNADTVAVLACPEMSGARLRDLAWALEKSGTIKSAFDRAVAASALALLLPLFLLTAAAIKLSDGGPAFFRQTRVGKDGKTFTLCKFRTMVVGAEHRQAELLVRNDSDGVLFKMRQDPRVTRIGRWLRRHSLDELPQLLNVLAGDMSLVGPRPALPDETNAYGYHVRRRLAVKPGITGLWQVNGRSDLPWDEAVRLDVRYVENWSFVLDLQILWKTWSAVWHGDGAYLSPGSLTLRSVPRTSHPAGAQPGCRHFHR